MSGERPNAAFDGFQKRSGLIVPFSWRKIELAIDRAGEDVSRKQGVAKNEGLASKVTGQVLQQLKRRLIVLKGILDRFDLRLFAIEFRRQFKPGCVCESS